MSDEDVRESDPVADEPRGPAEQPSRQPDEPVELTEFRRGVDFLTTTTAPVDQFRPELDAPSTSIDDQGGAQAAPVEGGGDQGSE
jgi:hypothetical protein